MTEYRANVRLIDLPTMTLAGLGADFISAMVQGTDAFSVLPKLWGQVSGMLESVQAGGRNVYESKAWMVGAMGEPELPPYAESNSEAQVEGRLHYFAGVRVDGLEAELVSAILAAGLQLRSFKGGRFAACEHVGQLDALGETTEWFYKTWLPTEAPDQRFGHHYEIYDERFKMGSPSSVVVICAPIRD